MVDVFDEGSSADLLEEVAGVHVITDHFEWLNLIIVQVTIGQALSVIRHQLEVEVARRVLCKLEEYDRGDVDNCLQHSQETDDEEDREDADAEATGLPLHVGPQVLRDSLEGRPAVLLYHDAPGLLLLEKLYLLDLGLCCKVVLERLVH